MAATTWITNMADAVNHIEPTRHLKVFSPADFGSTRIDIIGVGATGSRIALSIAKLGVSNLHIWDFDKIESHNLANQAFGLADVGRPKVEAMADLIKAQTGLEVVPHNEAVTGRTRLGNVVFLLTDTMKSRKEIWEGAIKYKPHISAMIETRMGVDEGRVYVARPTAPAEIDMWEGTLCDDKEATESLCGSRITVGPTAEVISGLAVWRFISWFKFHKDGGEAPPVETIMFLNPSGFMTRTP
jgi:molybdopterin/thiamine biosynthesis adenylyltransferase